MTVVGIDFSLAKTGVAVASVSRGEVSMHTEVVESPGHVKDTLTQRHARLTKLSTDIGDLVGKPDLAVIEGPSYGSVGGGQFDRYAAWWFVVSRLLRREVPVAVVPPASLKLAIADSGRADKAAIASAITRMYPDVTVFSSDVSDAVGLAHLGCVRLGWPVKTLARHKAVRCEWPEFGLPEVAA